MGREEAIARVAEALRHDRLVTLLGPPGIGKTRLAVETLRTAAGFFCDLSAAESLGGACEAIARALGGTLGHDPVASVGRVLESLGASLVVLDDFERLAPVAGEALASWLVVAPEARLLVTSRERLRIPGEVVVELEPLAPAEALTLLLDRARHTGYEPQVDDREVLDQVVRALEGIPLALELAATRLHLLGARGLADRLTQRLDLLGRGYRDAEARGATLRGAIDSSWQLLDDALRRALAAASVFRGGFTIAAGEAVVGSLDQLQDLRERSLLTQPSSGRLSMYESIRAFAAERLDELGFREAVEARHADHFLAFARRERAAYEATGGDLSRLVAERDNLLAVLERALRAGDRPRAREAVLALGPALASNGPASLHLELLDHVLALGPDPALRHARAGALRALGELDRAESDLRAVLAETDDGALRVAAEKDLGVLHHQRREIEAARARYEAALPAAREAGLRRTEAILIGNLAALDHDVGRFESAARQYARALDLLVAVGDIRAEGNFLTNLAVLEAEEGRREQARKHLERSLALLQRAGDRRLEAIALGNLGALDQEEGDLEAAEGHQRAAVAVLRAVGDVSSEALCRARLGAVLAQRGSLAEAEHQLERAERTVAGRDPVTTELVRLYRCFLELARGEEAAAFARLEAAREERGGGLSLAEIHDDARLVLRMLAVSMSTVGGPSLEIGPKARWFRPPGGSLRRLDKYAAARRILDRLAEHRLADPGAGLSADELFAAGWPGVTIAPESANNRLYVALAKLRKLGLKGLLLRREEGYMLDPATPLLRRAS